MDKKNTKRQYLCKPWLLPRSVQTEVFILVYTGVFIVVFTAASAADAADFIVIVIVIVIIVTVGTVVIAITTGISLADAAAGLALAA
jgi:hypothetical protein